MNVYQTDEVAAFLAVEELKHLLLEKSDAILEIGFDQVRLPFGSHQDPSQKVRSIAIQYRHATKPTIEINLLPCTDADGQRAVHVSLKTNEIRDGCHRVTFTPN